MPRLRITGTVMVIVGGVVFLVALAVLPYFSLPHFVPPVGYRLAHVVFVDQTLWNVTTREPVVLTMVAVAAIVSAAGGLLTDEAVLLILATGFSFYLFGRIFPVGPQTYDLYGAGLWVTTAAAFTMSVGGVLAVPQWRFARPS
jgi:hypothetical protein